MPSTIRSSGLSRTFSPAVIFSPLSVTPLVENRSSMNQSSPARVIRACLRLSVGSLITISQVSLRPMEYSSSVSWCFSPVILFVSSI